MFTIIFSSSFPLLQLCCPRHKSVNCLWSSNSLLCTREGQWIFQTFHLHFLQGVIVVTMLQCFIMVSTILRGIWCSVHMFSWWTCTFGGEIAQRQLTRIRKTKIWVPNRCVQRGCRKSRGLRMEVLSKIFCIFMLLCHVMIFILEFKRWEKGKQKWFIYCFHHSETCNFIKRNITLRC